MSPKKSQTQPESLQKCLFSMIPCIIYVSLCLPIRTYLFVSSILILKAKNLNESNEKKPH